MDDKDKIITEFIAEMLKAAPDDYMEIKLILLAHSAGKPSLVYFLQEVFKLVELHRPRLIEMKGGVVGEQMGRADLFID